MNEIQYKFKEKWKKKNLCLWLLAICLLTALTLQVHSSNKSRGLLHARLAKYLSRNESKQRCNFHLQITKLNEVVQHSRFLKLLLGQVGPHGPSLTLLHQMKQMKQSEFVKDFFFSCKITKNSYCESFKSWWQQPKSFVRIWKDLLDNFYKKYKNTPLGLSCSFFLLLTLKIHQTVVFSFEVSPTGLKACACTWHWTNLTFYCMVLYSNTDM